jgi:hypothetical protein
MKRKSWAEPRRQTLKTDLAGSRRGQRCMCQLNFAQEVREGVGVLLPAEGLDLAANGACAGCSMLVDCAVENVVRGLKHLTELLPSFKNP